MSRLKSSLRNLVTVKTQGFTTNVQCCPRKFREVYETETDDILPFQDSESPLLWIQDRVRETLKANRIVSEP